MITEPVHVARWGTYVTTPDITAEQAVVRVRNESGATAEVRIHSRTVDADGRTVARTASTAAVTDAATETHELTVARPRLWRPCGTGASDAPTVLTFAAVRGSRIRLTLTSAHPGEARGAAAPGIRPARARR